MGMLLLVLPPIGVIPVADARGVTGCEENYINQGTVSTL